MNEEEWINYDMLESKDENEKRHDIVSVGEALISELDEHKDLSAPLVKEQIDQLSLKFEA